MGMWEGKNSLLCSFFSLLTSTLNTMPRLVYSKTSSVCSVVVLELQLHALLFAAFYVSIEKVLRLYVAGNLGRARVDSSTIIGKVGRRIIGIHISKFSSKVHKKCFL